MISIFYDFKLISKDNERCQSRQGRYFLSAKYKAWENRVRWETKSKYKGLMLEGDIVLKVVAYFSNKKHCDATNLFKGLADAYNNLLYKDDKQIKEASIRVYEGKQYGDKFYVQLSQVEEP